MQPQQHHAPAEPEAFSQFPAPPGFFRLYEAGPTAGPPPPPPVKGQIHALGEFFDTEAPLVPPLEVPQLYTVRPDNTVDVKAELAKLSKGLLFLFLELLGVLVTQPSAYAPALSQVVVCLHNMGHLINLTRGHQAQQTLKLALQSQVAEKQAALQALKEQAASIRARVLSLTQQLAAAGSDAAESMPCALGQQQQQQLPQQQQQAVSMEEG